VSFAFHAQKVVFHTYMLHYSDILYTRENLDFCKIKLDLKSTNVYHKNIS